MNDTIDEFRGKYFFLSNIYPAQVDYQGYRFENNEAAFQAAKCPERMSEFCGLTPNAAKRLRRRVGTAARLGSCEVRCHVRGVYGEVYTESGFAFQTSCNR